MNYLIKIILSKYFTKSTGFDYSHVEIYKPNSTAITEKYFSNYESKLHIVKRVQRVLRYKVLNLFLTKNMR